MLFGHVMLLTDIVLQIIECPVLALDSLVQTLPTVPGRHSNPRPKPVDQREQDCVLVSCFARKPFDSSILGLEDFRYKRRLPDARFSQDVADFKAFAAEHPAISAVLTGTANQAHLEENAAALEKPSLADADRQRLVDLFGQIAEYA